MGWPIDMERKGCESTGSWTHFATFNYDLNHDIDLWFSRSNFQIAINDFSEMEGLNDSEHKGCEWDTMLDPLCNFELWPQSWLFRLGYCQLERI